MNYSKHYNLLIERARNRLLECYCERHHVIPKCMGGENGEIVKLTPEEHYVAHQLLVKMYPQEPKLVYAAIMMSRSSGSTPRSNKTYGWIRRKHSAAISDRLTGVKRPDVTLRMKGNKYRVGVQLSPEGKANLLKYAIGNKHNLGRKATKEACVNMSVAGKGKNLGRKRPDLAARNKARIMTPEVLAQLRAQSKLGAAVRWARG